ncbi:chaperone NapD [Chthonobacter albigriseus]|uniref:chaperone NapD n=1 Tax=Chthonobacter albigriseus TaxID=1683161 RepID=UPI0015EF6017|nr:chaperone NapD [Chthonobacter albigriseus]
MHEPRIDIVSSAVVTVKPGWDVAVASALGELPLTEIRAASTTKLVVILEGASRGEVGGRLARIALMDGVISANLVFEHVDEDGEVPG